MKKSTKLLLEIAKQTPGMGTFEFYGEESEEQFIWDMFHVDAALCEPISLKKEVTYIYAYEDALDIELPIGDFYLKTEDGDIIKLYEV